MYREKLNDLYEWKKKKNKQPLLVRGARKTGKTWIVQEFANQMYSNVIYVELGEKIVCNYLNEIKKLENIQDVLNLEFDRNSDDIILILDNIENITDLKELQIIVDKMTCDIILITSRLLESDLKFNVRTLKLFPLTYLEFLYAIEENELADYIEKLDFENINRESKKYINNLKKYIYIGGMPEVVKRFAETKDYRLVREKQEEIINIIINDMKEEGTVLGDELKTVFLNSIEQVQKEQKEFDFRNIKIGTRLVQYEPIVNILKQRGYVYKVNKALRPGIPMDAFQDISNFKLFPFDVGLISCLMNLDLSIILQGNEIFKVANSVFEKQFVIQELSNKIGTQIYYWKESNTKYEIDFLVQLQAKVIPIKINLWDNKIDSSIRWFHRKFENYSSVNITFERYKWQGWYTDIPIFLVGKIKELIAKNKLNWS